MRATAYVAAQHKYQLWVNGARADTGPSFSYPDEQYVQATDVTRFLKAGSANAIGVLHHWYGAGQGRPAAEPGLLLQVSVVHRDGSARDGRHRRDLAPAPGGMEAGAAAQRRGRPRRARRRAPEPARVGDRGLRRHGLDAGAGARPRRHTALHRPRPTAHPHRRAGPPPGVGEAAEGRRGRGRPRRGLRGHADGRVPQGARRAADQAARRLRPRPGRSRLHVPQHAGHRPQLPVHRTRRRADVPAVPLPRVPIPRGRRARRATRGRAARRVRAPHGDARHVGIDGDVPLVEPDARRGVAPRPARARSTPRRSSSSTRRRARRDSSSPTPTTSRWRRWPVSASRT